MNKKNVEVLGRAEANVGHILAPKSIAVVGASEDLKKFGGRIPHYLMKHGYEGAIYLINAKRTELFGRPAFASIEQLPEAPELVLVALPNKFVLEVVESAGKLGAKGVVIISNGFAETGNEAGIKLERQLLEIAHRYGMRILGPNCLGFVSAVNDCALFPSHVLARESIPKGSIGMVSQSGGVLSGMMDSAFSQGIGFSHAIALGNQADLDISDFVDFMIDDEQTKVICSYVEGIASPERFVEVARRARKKGIPWLMLKSGRTEEGMEAAFSHTASLAGGYEAFATVCRENGVILLTDMEMMLPLAILLEHHPQGRMDKIAVVSPSGGSCVMAADLLTENGVPLAQLQDETIEALRDYFPRGVNNPADTGAAAIDALIGAGKPVAEALARDPNVDLILSVISTCPDVAGAAKNIILGVDKVGTKPCLTVLQPAALADEARDQLRENRVPFTDSLHTAVRAIAALREARQERSRTIATRPHVEKITETLPGGVLGEDETKRFLESYGVKTNAGRIAKSSEEAFEIAQKLKAPLVVKIVSPDITHKADVGGVKLELNDAEAVKQCVENMRINVEKLRPDAQIDGFLIQEQVSGFAEVMVGVRHDDLFGHMVMVSAGGSLVELLADVAMASAPVSVEDAKHLLGKIKFSKILRGFRGQPELDINAVAEAISRISWLACDLGDRLLEMDINPLLVGRKGEGCVAVDGRALFKNS